MMMLARVLTSAALMLTFAAAAASGADAAPLLKDARAALVDGDWGRARRLLQQRVEQIPGHHESWALLGQLALETGQWSEAVRAYQSLVVLRPEQPQGWRRLAHAQERSGDWQQARSALQQVLKLDPGAGDYAYMARVLQQLGDHDGALQALLEAVDSAPGRAGYWFSLGLAYERVNQPDQALAALRRAARLAPRTPVILESLAHIALESGRLPLAQQTCETLVELDERHVGWRKCLADALAWQGQWAMARGHYQQAAEAEPDAAYLWQSLATAAAETGRWGDALQAYQRAVQAQGSLFAEIHATLRARDPVLAQEFARLHQLRTGGRP